MKNLKIFEKITKKRIDKLIIKILNKLKIFAGSL